MDLKQDDDIGKDEQCIGLAVGPDRGEMTAQFQELVAPNPGHTLLPSPVARAVSFTTRSMSLALRMGTVVGGYGFDAARVTTLSSLELGRSIVEGILGRAGRDIVHRSQSELAKTDAETVLERSLENLHRTMTSVVFWTTAGFEVAGTTLSIWSGVSQLLLSTLDQILGSTESSRAMASIIHLIRREFQNPATGVQGERVGVFDLILGLCGMAYLQRWCRRLVDEENRRLDVEEVVWDVVVLNDGQRVDVREESLYRVSGLEGHDPSPSRASIVNDGANGRIVATIEGHASRESDDEDDGLPEIRLKRQIIKSLPEGADVAITTSIQTTKTIRVDITGTPPLPLAPPPGVELVEQSRTLVPAASLEASAESSALPPEGLPPTYRVVYRVNRNSERRTSFRKENGDRSQVPGFVEPLEDSDGNDKAVGAPAPIPPKPAPPPKDKVTTSRKRQDKDSLPRSASSSSTQSIPSPQPVKVSRIPSLPRASPEANQKRTRMPLTSTNKFANNNTTPGPMSSRKQSLNRLLQSKSGREDNVSVPKPTTERKGGLRSVLRKGTVPSLSNFLHKDDSGSDTTGHNAKGKQKPDKAVARRAAKSQTKGTPTTPPTLLVPGRAASLIPRRDPPRLPAKSLQPKNARPPNSKKEVVEDPFPRSSSRASYISVHEHRRDSIVSQTDTYSIAPADDYRARSPIHRAGASSSMQKSRSEKDVPQFGSPLRTQRRVKSQLYSPSIYTLKTNDSQTSLVPYYQYQKSAYGDTEALMTLRQAGMVEGIFPKHHLLRNIARYIRFASASYGSNFLKMMGIAKAIPMALMRSMGETHHELRSFAHHTDSEAESILLSSFVDPQGGSDGTGSTNTGVPLVHYISLDHESKAVVLACRGTLGFEDVLADMACDYDDLIWRGKSYKVHKGIHASARRLLYGGDGRVLVTLRQALVEFTDYGLVLTGHSLGGAVTALLGVMLSEPVAGGTSFLTTSEPQHPNKLLLDDGSYMPVPDYMMPLHISLPPGRPIHVYAYGPPSTMSASLSRATRGLITSIVNGNDLVPYLSLGVLHDFQAMALAFKSDNNDAKTEVRQRIREQFQSGIARKWYNSGPKPPSSKEDDQWAYAALKVLRSSMMSHKLLPPGEVFTVEKTRVLRREAFVVPKDGEEHLGRPARRLVLKYVRDVEKRFREVRFGTSMLTDHSPGRYEEALNRLRTGVLEREV